MGPRLILLDIDGTLTDGLGGPPLPGAVEAVARLRRAFPVRLVTNATSRPRAGLVAWLQALRLLEDPDHLVTPVSTARRVLGSRGDASGLLLAEPDCLGDYQWFTPQDDGRAVLLATQAHDLTIGDLQPAVRMLLGGAGLYTLQKTRYFRRDGEMVTDLGPVAAFLEYAAGVEAENLGKPSRVLYESVAAAADLRLEELLMVGDDVEADAAGPTALGMTGVLVRTGKYRPGDEQRAQPAPAWVLDSMVQLPDRLDLA